MNRTVCNERAVSLLVATLMMISVALAAGILVYSIISGSLATLVGRTHAAVESVNMVRDTQGYVTFAITIKNNGEKAITECNVTVKGDDANATLSLGGMEPGRSRSAIFHAGELLKNPTVESGATLPDYWGVWPPGSPSAYWTTEESHSPNRSLKINCTSPSSLSWYSAVFAVNEGRTYTFKGYFKGNITSGGWILSILWYRNADKTGYLGYTPIYLTGYHAWNLVSEVAAAPSGAKYADLEFWTSDGVGTLYGDDFSVRETKPFATIGKEYIVVVKAKSIDGSTFTASFTVKCVGS